MKLHLTVDLNQLIKAAMQFHETIVKTTHAKTYCCRGIDQDHC